MNGGIHCGRAAKLETKLEVENGENDRYLWVDVY